MNRKILFNIFSFLIITAFILSACAQQPAAEEPAAEEPAAEEPAAEAPAEMVTIRWRTRPDNQAEQDVYQKISDQLSEKLAAGHQAAVRPGARDRLPG